MILGRNPGYLNWDDADDRDRHSSRACAHFSEDTYLARLTALAETLLSSHKPLGINLSHDVIDYFKNLSDEASVPYQTLIDLYLRDCVKNKKKLKLDWAT